MVGQVRAAIFVGALTSFLFTGSAVALDPERSITQFKHTVWTRDDGAPAPIVDLDQSGDGFLWLASRDGVFRFDGVLFERIDADINGGAHGSASQVLVTKSGDVWISYSGSGRFAVYRNGRTRLIASPPRIGTITFLLEGADGAIWALHGEAGRPFYRHLNGRWAAVHPLPGKRDYVWSAHTAPDGTIWVSFRDHIARLPPGATEFEQVATPPGRQPMLSIDRHGNVWSPASRDLVRIGGEAAGFPGRSSFIAIRIPERSRRQHGVFDDDGALWIANGFEGIERLRGLGARPGLETPRLRVDTFSRGDGIAGYVQGVFKDREGNIWLATTRGLERFRDVNIAVEPALTNPGRYGDVLLSTASGDVYVGEADAVYRVRPRGAPEFVAPGEPEAMCEDNAGGVWMIFSDAVMRFDGAGFRTMPGPPARETSMHACAVDHGGRLWAVAGASGAYTLEGVRWKKVKPARPGEDLYPSHISSIGPDTFWIQWNAASLARMTPQGLVFTQLRGIDGLTVRAMHWTGKGLFFSADEGLARVESGKLNLIGRAQVSYLARTNGFIQTPGGDSWVYGGRGLIRLKTADLERAFRQPHYVPPMRLFSYEDGLPDAPSSQSLRPLVRGGDGRLWFTTAAGPAWLDPTRLRFNRVPPGVVITRLAVGETTMRDPSVVRLKPGTSRVGISFAVPSLSQPEGVKVLYRLDGYDEDWVDPGTRRQVSYANLSPGTYRFRVIAANREGVWNRQGDTLEITLPPTFLQSIWFKLTVLLVALGLAVIAYNARVGHLAARLQRQFEVRVAERERIARELHDTLLQGIQGLMLRFQAAANRVADADVRSTLDDALERAESVLVEGRARVRDLRGTSTSGELAQGLLNLADAIVEGEEPRVDLTLSGERRPVHVLVEQEAFRIAEEAIRNVVKHSRATRLDMVVSYGSRELTVAIRDDGAGIPDEVLSNGSPLGHFGLVGMRERAEQIGGELRMRSSQGRGTEIALVVPARAAYARRRFSLPRPFRRSEA